jgi:kinetochore protein NDC80
LFKSGKRGEFLKIMAPPSRRSTLGPVNMNRRQSIGAPLSETPGKANARRPPKGRKSMLPRVGRESLIPPSPAAGSTASSRRRSVGGDRRMSMDRRQSLVPPPSHTVVKVDPRPITDKAYQGQCIKQLLQYLTKNGYAYPISPKSLSRPSGKDFSNIVSFMLRKLDPSFQDGSMKLEDEVAMNFKAMGYPYPISKTALVAAGSPHTWPTLLAALTWLMEHLQCQEADEEEEQMDDESNKAFETMEELERKTDRAFFKFLTDNYTAFLEGNQAMTEDLEERFVDTFEHDNMVIEQEIERVNELNGLIVEKMNHLGQQSQS